MKYSLRNADFITTKLNRNYRLNSGVHPLVLRHKLQLAPPYCNSTNP